MNHAAILILCVGLAAVTAVTAACRPEKTIREGQGGATSPGGGQLGMAPAPGSSMTREAPMDFSLPPGDDGSGGSGGSSSSSGRATGGSPGGPEKPGDLKAALADLDRIRARQTQVVKLWQTLHNVADAQRHRRAILKGGLDVLALTIASVKKAVNLSEAGLAQFLDKQRVQRAQTRKMHEIIKAKQRLLKAQPGGKAFFESLKQSATVEVRKQTQTLLMLGRKLLRRKKELKR